MSSDTAKPLTVRQLREITRGATDGPDAFLKLFAHLSLFPVRITAANRPLEAFAALTTAMRTYLHSQPFSLSVEIGLANRDGALGMATGRGSMGEQIVSLVALMAPNKQAMSGMGFSNGLVEHLTSQPCQIIGHNGHAQNDNVWWATITQHALIVGGRSLWDADEKN